MTQPRVDTADNTWQRELDRRAKGVRKARFWWIEALVIAAVVWGSIGVADACFSTTGFYVSAVFWTIAIPAFHHAVGRGNC